MDSGTDIRYSQPCSLAIHLKTTPSKKEFGRFLGVMLIWDIFGLS